MIPTKSKKPAEGLLIGLLSEKPSKGKPEESEKPESETSEDMESEGPDYELMAQEVLDAIESKDASGLAESLRSFFEACGSEDE